MAFTLTCMLEGIAYLNGFMERRDDAIHVRHCKTKIETRKGVKTYYDHRTKEIKHPLCSFISFIVLTVS